MTRTIYAIEPHEALSICRGITKQGKDCRAPATVLEAYCVWHANQDVSIWKDCVVCPHCPSGWVLTERQTECGNCTNKRKQKAAQEVKKAAQEKESRGDLAIVPIVGRIRKMRDGNYRLAIPGPGGTKQWVTIDQDLMAQVK